MRLEGEIAVVTGAAGSLGAPIADALEVEGAQVARTDLEGTELRLDVSDRGSVEAAVEHVSATLGPPSVLVNNTGISRVGPSESLDEAVWSEVLELNLTGVLRCCQATGPRMLAAGRGAIVNIASQRPTRHAGAGGLLCQQGRARRVDPRPGRGVGVSGRAGQRCLPRLRPYAHGG
jgi:NAD(P)-dependent dehydrogenase (short-subunit alcohol dehydrogenase family)